MLRGRSTWLGWRTAAIVVWVAWLTLAGWMFGTHRWGSLPVVADACGSPAPDVRFAPSPQVTLSFIQGCRSRGAVATYAHLQVLDLAYPLLVAVVLVVSLLALTGSRPRLRSLTVIPVIASLGDYVENIGAWVLISGSNPAWALRTIQSGSFTKTTLTWCSWLSLITLAGVQLSARMARLRTRTSAAPRRT